MSGVSVGGAATQRAAAKAAMRGCCCGPPGLAAAAHSMQILPCLSSASRRNLISRKSERYSGSKPASAPSSFDDWLAGAVRKGIAFAGLLIPMLAEVERTDERD